MKTLLSMAWRKEESDWHPTVSCICQVSFAALYSLFVNASYCLSTVGINVGPIALLLFAAIVEPITRLDKYQDVGVRVDGEV